jgi:hypothetical protein
MREVTIECSIDGQRYTSDQLTRVDYDRHRHVLHEMKRLGTSIRHRGRLLSDDDINRLNYDEARQVSIAARTSYDTEGITQLYAEQLRASDQMWKDIDEASRGAPLLPAVTDIAVRGITIDEFRSYAESPDNMRSTFTQMNPDHYFFHGGAPGTRIMETFGMYGGPTDTYAVVDPTVSAPIQAEPDYELLTAGYATLASDGTNINVSALHQIKALDNGLAIKLGAFFPAKTPRAVVDGHKLHMAIECWQMSELIGHSL